MHIHGRESAEWESVERSAASSDHGQPESGGCSWASENRPEQPKGQQGHCVTWDPRVRLCKRKKINGVMTEWHTGIAEDEVGHSGAKQLFNSFLV